jgi:hypothetical protein
MCMYVLCVYVCARVCVCVCVCGVGSPCESNCLLHCSVLCSVWVETWLCQLVTCRELHLTCINRIHSLLTSGSVSRSEHSLQNKQRQHNNDVSETSTTPLLRLAPARLPVVKALAAWLHVTVNIAGCDACHCTHPLHSKRKWKPEGSVQPMCAAPLVGSWRPFNNVLSRRTSTTQSDGSMQLIRYIVSLPTSEEGARSRRHGTYVRHAHNHRACRRCRAMAESWRSSSCTCNIDPTDRLMPFPLTVRRHRPTMAADTNAGTADRSDCSGALCTGRRRHMSTASHTYFMMLSTVRRSRCCAPDARPAAHSTTPATATASNDNTNSCTYNNTSNSNSKQ